MRDTNGLKETTRVTAPVASNTLSVNIFTAPGIEPATNGIPLRGSQCTELHGIGSDQNAPRPRKFVGRSVQIQCSD
jgi:hypothetical protein